MPGNGNGNNFPELEVNGKKVKEMHIDNLSADKLYIKNEDSFNYEYSKKCIFSTQDITLENSKSGTGFLVKGSDGNIYGITTLRNTSLTPNLSSTIEYFNNYIENRNMKIYLDNQKIECREIGISDSANIVVIKLLGVDQSKLHYFEFEDYENIKVGDTVFALGHYPIDNSTLSKGIVRDPIWSFEYASCENLFHDCDMYNSDVSSGHALLNNNGKIIGMHGYQRNLDADSLSGGPNSTTIKNILENIIQTNSNKNKEFSVMSKLVGKSGILIYNENNELIYNSNNPQVKNLNLILSQYVLIEYGNNYTDENDTTKVATRNLEDPENDYFMIAGKKFYPNFNRQYFFNSGKSGIIMDGESLDYEIVYSNDLDSSGEPSIVNSFRFYLGIQWLFNLNNNGYENIKYGQEYYERNYFGKRFATYSLAETGLDDNLEKLISDNWLNLNMEIIPTNQKFKKILNFTEPLEIDYNFFNSLNQFFSRGEYAETTWESMTYTNDNGEKINLIEAENKRSMLSIMNLTMDDLQVTRKRLINSKINNKEDSFLVDITLNIWVDVDFSKLNSSPPENPLVHITTRGVNSIRASVTLKNLDLYRLLTNSIGSIGLNQIYVLNNFFI